jgi:general secretion pathway protein J
MTSSRLGRRTGQAGFTLLEVLIAMALMGAILAFLATVTAQWLPNWDRGFARVQRNELLALGLERIVGDVAAARFIPVGRDTRQISFDGMATSITFVRPVLAPRAEPALEIVRLAETNTSQGVTLVRARAPFAPIVRGVNDRDQPAFADPVVLIRPPYRIVFSYAGPDRIWQETWRQSDQLPRAVRVTLQDAITRTALAASTATLVHSEIPPTCVRANSLADCLASQRQTQKSPAGEGAGPRDAEARPR